VPRIASGAWDNTVRVWSSATGACERIMEGHTSGVLCLAPLPDGRLVSGSADGTARVWDVKLGECLRVLRPPQAVLTKSTGSFK
jgi:WD40 repeat protein